MTSRNRQASSILASISLSSISLIPSLTQPTRTAVTMGFKKSFTPLPLKQATPSPRPVTHPQDQSPLFTTLPLEIRHHIYQQLWLDYGLTQHILAMTEKSYLLTFPCVLSPEELNRAPGSPAASTSPATPADAGDAADATNATEDDAGGANDDGEATEQPQPDDDPGDIAAAVQDVSGGDFEPPNNDPWCAHFACFRNCSQKWDHSFSSMYTACYRSHRPGPDLRDSAVLTSFLVCRRMYQEASEDLFSKMRFSFSSMVAMDVFTSQVPRALVSRVKFVNVSCLVQLCRASVHCFS